VSLKISRERATQLGKSTTSSCAFPTEPAPKFAMVTSPLNGGQSSMLPPHHHKPTMFQADLSWADPNTELVGERRQRRKGKARTDTQTPSTDNISSNRYQKVDNRFQNPGPFRTPFGFFPFEHDCNKQPSLMAVSAQDDGRLHDHRNNCK